MKDPLLTSYVTSQAGWSEEVTTHWSNKRARLLSKTLAKCAGLEVKTCLEALTNDEVMKKIEKDLKVTCTTTGTLQEQGQW